MISYNQETIRVNNIISSVNHTTEIDFLEKEIQKFLNSPIRRDMIVANRYYQGLHDILKRKRTVIGKDGEIEEVYNLPNNKLIDNQYAKLVDQKTNYLLGRKFTLDCVEKSMLDSYNAILDDKFHKTLNSIGKDALNCGLGYVYVYINEQGCIDFKRFKPFEILPFWEDDENTKLNMVARIYKVLVYEKTEKEVIKVELYKTEGVVYYELDGSRLILDIGRMGNDEIKPYITISNKVYNWGSVPIIAFKSNAEEIQLIKRVKPLQDALNTVRSDFMNNMQEDARNSILVLKNYDGTNLAEFRKNLAEYGAIKVRNDEGGNSGVDVLKIEIDGSNYELMLNSLKKAIIENARGFDAKDERLNNNPNQMNIQSMLADIDLDANTMELEFKSSLQRVFSFINMYLNIANKGIKNEKVNVIFNKDQLLNESEIIESCKNSIGILSMETIISQHPYVSDVAKELERIKAENTELEKDADMYD